MSIDFSAELNQEQLDAVLHSDGPCLILAGAGSGKTRTLTYRVAYLLEQGVDPSEILLLTFTNKAAKEMLARVSMLAGEASRGIWGGTFHSVASRILRGFAPQLGYKSNFTILDSEDGHDLVKAVMKDLSIDYKSKRTPSPKVTADIISLARNSQRPLAEVLEEKHPNFVFFAGDLEEVARQYQARKKAANAMDFDDLLSNLALLLDDPQSGQAITGRFRYVLVDEYQDTNAMQARLVYGFARRRQNVVVVGDDAQSIYSFRGAQVKNILSFPDQWPGSKVFRLVTNYRSTPEILELANDSLAHNVEQFKKDLIGRRQSGDLPKMVPCASAVAEARWVADRILALRAQNVNPRHMAVLFRSSGHSQALEMELMRRDIPYEYRGGQKFFERAHIKDVLCFLRVAHNPVDEVAWLRVLGLQSGIGASSAVAVAKSVQQLAATLPQLLADGLEPAVPSRAITGWQDFKRAASLMLADGQLPGAMIKALCRSTYRDYLEAEYPNWRERLEDLEQLSIFAESYGELAGFLHDIALYDEAMGARRQAVASPTDDERLILSTIHQAKGLEWDTVFVIHLADTAFPNRRALGEEGGLEEERRLFYVAVTRAQKRLFLTYPVTVGHDTMSFCQPSLFLDELAPHLLQREETLEARSGRSYSWDDGGYEEPTVQRDNYGESGGHGTVVWKSSGEPKPIAPKSFLRDVGEL